MTDPVSVTTGVAGLISLGITVSQSLVDFYNSYKDFDSDLNGTLKRLESLLKIFQYLGETVSNRKFQADERDLVDNIEASISECRKLIYELQHEWKKLSKKTSSSGCKAVFRVARHRATYPLRKSTLQKMDEAINKIRTNLSSALEVLQLKGNEKIQNDVADIQINQLSSELRSWLKAPDATIDHDAACSKKHPGTGSWLIDDSRYSKWFTEGNSILWLHGFAGSGKSVLCSTVIESVISHRESDPSIGIAYFYFTFNDDSKQDESGMLRALVLQLSTQLEDGHADFVGIYNSYKAGIAPPRALIAHLRFLIEKFERVYIMLDALDECPRARSQVHVRRHVLKALTTMRKWALQRLHLFVTSRVERDIRELFDSDHFNTQEIAMQDPGIDEDIAKFVSGRFDTDLSLRKWEEHRHMIQETLARRAKGVFRWVECQLDSLESCPCSPSHLDRLLNSLPESLDETYERMLCKIDIRLIEDARRILTLLCFASRPLTLPELIDGIAVEPTGLNKGSRLADYNDINAICPGFTSHNVAANQTLTVQIAHFSIQKYLESDRIQHQKADAFGLTSVKAHEEIAQICLIYLLEPNLSSSVLNQNILKEYPLAQFAAEYWHIHYKRTANRSSELDILISRLLQQKESFMAWVKLHNVDDPQETGDSSLYAANPVYYASLLGLDQPLHELLKTKLREDINAQGGIIGNALHAASSKGHVKVVRQLLAKGADINQVGPYGTALRLASSYGHQKVVQLLLDKRADANIHSEKIGNALQAASSEGHEKVVQQLLDKGADINQVGQYGTALQLASSYGRQKVVQLLLDKGADINAQGGQYGNALRAASSKGHEKVVQQLLEKGADTDTQDGQYGTALQAALHHGHEKVVQLLLDRWQDIDAQGGLYGTALQLTSSYGHQKMVQLLLNKGVDVNAQGGLFGTALQAAVHHGHRKVVQQLLKEGANTNAQGGNLGNALQAASYGGDKEMVQLLLDRGADVNAQGGPYSHALQAASFRGYKEVVQQLLDRGADVNAYGGECGNALQAALLQGHMDVVELLLNTGADVNIQGGKFNNTLEAASFTGNKDVVQSLLDRGADVNAQGNGYFGSALQAASYQGYEKVVQLLLDKGADVNAQGGKFGNALAAASHHGHEKVVQQLLNKGADINAQGGEYGNALQAASASHRDCEKVVQLLLDKGADINAQGGGSFNNALQAASYNGHEEVVQLLLDRGADINAQGGGSFRNALQAASSRGFEKVVQVLRDRGAVSKKEEEVQRED